MAELFAEIDRSSRRASGGRRYTLPLSIAVHAALVLLLIAVPLIATGVVPTPTSLLVFAAPELPKPPEIPSAPSPAKPVSAATAVTPVATVPTDAPATIQPETPAQYAISAISGGLPPGFAGTMGAPNGLALLPLPAPATPPEPVRPGGQVKEPVKIRDVAPIYPQIAINAHIGGVVIIDAVIDTDGRVSNATVLRSVPLLDQPALDAVRQWRYRPTLLNGVPVAVRITVTVNFAIK